MLTFLKRNIFITILFLSTLSLGFIIFLTFINKSFLQINDTNFQVLLFFTIILLFLLFGLIFFEVKNSIKSNINIKGYIANKKYIVFFFVIYSHTIFAYINFLLIYIFICS